MKKIISGILTICFLLTSVPQQLIQAEEKSKTIDVKLNITSISSDTDSMRNSLQKLITMANKLNNEAIVGISPGQYNLNAKSSFRSSILQAQNVYDNISSNYDSLKVAVNALIEAGNTFIKSVNTSMEIKDVKENTLVYSTYRVELTDLVWQAKAALEVEPELYTEADKIALLDQINHAEEVLNGTYKLPFIRTRAFHVPRADENIQASIEYYTFVPSYDYNDVDTKNDTDPSNDVRTYGLKNALKWYKSENIILDSTKLETSINYALNTAADMLKKPVGSDVGQYPQEAVSKLKAEYDSALNVASKSMDAREILKSLVKLFNAIQDMRLAQVLRLEVEPESNLYYSKDNINELKNKINSDPLLKAEYDKIKAESDQLSLEDIKLYNDNILGEVPNYDAVNAKFQLWTNSANSNSFTTPANTAAITLAFTLPSYENEQEGNFGHVWIDDVNIKGSAALAIDSKDFEVGTDNPTSWMSVADKGNPVLRWENRPEKDASGKATYAYSGTHSIYIQNPTSKDQGSWVYQKDIAVSSNTKYTISYNAKIDGNPKNGVQAVIKYKDTDGNYIKDEAGNHITFTSAVRKGSMFTGMNFNKTYQFDAIVYAVTGDITYAQKAKERMLWITNDMCNGIENWLTENVRPFGIDAYGAVQEGRFGCTLSSAYTLIKDSGVFSAEEYKKLTSRIDYILRDLTDLRNREQMDDYTAQANTNNWVSDMSIGAALLALTFPDLPNSKQWLINGAKITRGQLQYTVNNDGSWPESIRYLNALIEKFSVFAKAYRNATGEDWFLGSKVGKMFEFLSSVQTPQYEFLNNQISTPDYGDHNLTDAGGQFAIIGNYCDELVKNNPKLATALYETWVRAGRPKMAYGHETVNLQNFFAPSSFENKGNNSFMLKSAAFKDYGLYIFRNNFKRKNESYFSIIANNPALINHRHQDQGSFILYANSVPLVMDPGVEGYFDSTNAWYKSSKAHSTLQFMNNGAVNDTPDSSEVKDFYISHPMDFISMDINNSKGSGTQTRNVAYVKNGIEAYIIWDQIKDATEGTVFNLPVAASKDSVIEGNKITSTGHFNMDLETTVLQPENPKITQEWGRATAAQPKVNGSNQLNYLRIAAGINENHLTILYPKQTDAAGLTTEKIALENSKVDAYKLQTTDGKWVIIAINNGSEEQRIDIGSSETLVDMRSNMQWIANNNNNVSASVKGNSIIVLKPESLVDVVPAEELVEDALAAKDFYSFNKAYDKVTKLSNEDEKAVLLYRLSTISDLVCNENIKKITKLMEELSKTGSGRVYDYINEMIISSNLSKVDKNYLFGELAALGKKLVFTDEYKKAVDALNIAWTKLDADSISKAEAEIAKVTNSYSKDYLSGELVKAKASIKK